MQSHQLKRREFITLLGGATAAWPLVALAQSAYRIGVLDTTSAALNAANFDALRQGLRQHGYIEGQNLVIEYRSADGRAERFPDLAAELVRLNVDLIVTRGTPAIFAAKNATKTIPVVMAASGDPLGAGVVAGLARPRECHRPERLCHRIAGETARTAERDGPEDRPNCGPA